MAERADEIPFFKFAINLLRHNAHLICVPILRIFCALEPVFCGITGTISFGSIFAFSESFFAADLVCLGVGTLVDVCSLVRHVV